MSELTSGNYLGFLLNDTSRLFRQFFERKVTENGFGLTPGEIRALGYTIRSRGSRQAVIAERMGVEPMTLSAYLDRLEAQGFVERRVDPTDRRAKIVEPTSEATKVMRSLDPVFDEIYRHLTRGMDEPSIRVLAETLRKLRENLAVEPDLVADIDLLADPAGRAVPVPAKA